MTKHQTRGSGLELVRSAEKSSCAELNFVIQSNFKMNDRARAEEDLRVIRTFMERATTYRAISAPTAMVGGIL
jgi:hypothetical protein